MKDACNQFLLTLVLLFSIQQVSYTQNTKTNLQKMYIEYLVEEGYKAKVDDDGDVTFKHEGIEYYISVDEEDPEFFKLGRNGVWKIDSLEERVKCIEATNYATSKTKVAKAWIKDDKVHFDIQVFVEKPEEFRQIFNRCISALVMCFQNFRLKMAEG